MKKTLQNLLIRTVTLGILAGAFAHEGVAATVSWEMLADRERAVIHLNNEEGFAGQVRRVEPMGLLVEFTLPPYEAGSVQAPGEAAIFRMAEPRGQALAFFTRTDAFGFIATRPDRRTVVLDVFPDPMGRRWRPSSNSTAPAAAPATAPVAEASPVPSPVETPGAPAAPETPAGAESVSQNPERPVVDVSPAPSENPSSVVIPPGPRTSESATPSTADSSVTAGTAGTGETAVAQTNPPESAATAAPQLSHEGEEGDANGESAAGAREAPAVSDAAGTANAAETPQAPPPDPVLPMPAQGGQGAASAAQSADAALAATTPLALPEDPPDAEGLSAPVLDPPFTATVPASDLAVEPLQAAEPSHGTGGEGPVTAMRGRISFDELAPEPIVPEEYAGVPLQSALRPADASGPSAFRSRINPGSVTDWYEMQRGAAQPGAATAPPRPGPAISPHEAAVQSQRGENPESAEPGPVTAPDGAQVTYVDSEGKTVEAPPDPEVVMAEMNQLIGAGAFAQALEKAELLLRHPFLPPEQRGEVLHARSELLFALHKNDLAANFETLVGATEEALNYDRESPRNAAALLRLGYINLQMNNTAEANAYFNMLRTRFPMDENIPLTYYYWGDYYAGRGEMLRAADQYQYVVQHFAESPYARDASVGLARSYMALGYFPQAFQVVEYIESRWPRYYLENPSILELMGDAAYKLDKLDYALNKYWIFYNLTPDAPNADVALTRIGDIYSSRKLQEAARSVYQEAVRRFPDKDGGLVAMMRLAEDGVNDAPSLTEMLSVFDGPYNLAPAATYRKIINEHPESQLVPLARLKLAMWLLWNRQYEEAIQVASALVDETPDSELAPRAREVAGRAFEIMAAESVAQGRSSQVQELWDKYPIVSGQAELLEPESRVALGVSLWQEGDPTRALEAIDPLFLGNKIPEYSEMALTLALNIYFELELWNRIQELHERVALWNLTPETQRQMDYAVALAHENLDQNEQAVPIWNKLHRAGGLDESQLAYTEFFLARDAEKKRDLKAAYTFGYSALNRFMGMARTNPSGADDGRINSLLSSLMDITEDAGRFSESLEYAHQYLDRLPADDSQRQGVQFRMSQIYRKQGNDQEWRRLLTELAERYPDSFYGRTAASQLRGARLAEEAAQFSPTGAL